MPNPKPIFPEPTPDEARTVLATCRPDLADAPLAYLDQGWDFWVYRAGDYVLRLPTNPDHEHKLRVEAPLSAALAPTLPYPIPVLELHDNAFRGHAISIHRFLPGVAVRDLKRPLGPGFGAALGSFVKGLQAFPVEQAVELGVAAYDGAAARQARIELYESVIRRVFPLVGCETRTYVEQRFEAYLNEPSNFEFEPKLLHHDIDRRNVLADPETGELVGVVDFGDAVAGNPAIDLWMAMVDFPALGIGAQTPAFLQAYGIRQEDAPRVQAEVEFVQFKWPFDEILHGVDVGDEEFAEQGIRSLNDATPRDVVCE